MTAAVATAAVSKKRQHQKTAPPRFERVAHANRHAGEDKLAAMAPPESSQPLEHGYEL